MAEKQSNKDKLKEITESIEKGIQELFQSEKYRQYLRTMSHFHKYSVNNTMLIYMLPTQTLCGKTNGRPKLRMKQLPKNRSMRALHRGRCRCVTRTVKHRKCVDTTIFRFV